MVVLAYLGGVENEFLCNQWWRKGMHTDIYHWYLDILDKGLPHCLAWLFKKCVCFCNYCADGAWSEEHDDRLLVDTWSVLHGLLRKHMKWDRLYCILRFLNFSDNKKEHDKKDGNYDWLWKMGALFDNHSDSYTKYCSLTDHLAVDEIIVLFKGIVIFKQYTGCFTTLGHNCRRWFPRSLWSKKFI